MTVFVGINCAQNDCKEIYKGESVVINPEKLPSPNNGDSFWECNFARFYKKTAIFSGIDNLHFEFCQLQNIKIINPTWTFKTCAISECDNIIEEDL